MDFDFSPLIDSWRFLASGLGLTILLSVAAVFCSFVLGLAVGLGRMYGPGWLRVLLAFYIDSMRAIPVFVVLVWIYFAVPIISGYSFDPFWAALTGITIHVAAYVAEVIRAGITSIRKGQIQAGLAIGMSGAQIVRQILLPQAIVRMLPAFGSIVSVTIKDTAIASVIAVPELMKQVGDRGWPELPADRGLHLRHGRLFPADSLPFHPADGCHLQARRASGAVMTFDWTIVWQYRYDLFEGALLTILLTVLTMLVAVPGGIVLALMRGVARQACRGLFATGFVELFRNLPLHPGRLLGVLRHAGADRPWTAAFTTGLVALCLNVSAYNSETFRAGHQLDPQRPDRCRHLRSA